MGFRFVFPKRPGRSYAYRSTAEIPPATPDAGAEVKRGRTLPVRGSQPDEISTPGSRRISDADAYSPGRSYLGRTEDTLNTGVAPNRIDRGTNAIDRGKIGVGAGPEGIGGWPYDASWSFIPHLLIPRTPITVSPFQRTIDTSARVQSQPIGGPIE